MSGFVDLHCHWIAAIDDGARSPGEGIDMLRALGKLGFRRIIATPHMRPGMFENSRDDLSAAFAKMTPYVEREPGLPDVALSSEHYFDETVYNRIMEGMALPYPGERAILLEFYEVDFPPGITHRLRDIQRRNLLPVIAHPERYRCMWKRPETLESLVDAGAAALLDTAALVGKYGRRPRKCAEELLKRGLYHAACSDAHRPSDADPVGRGIEWIRHRYGDEEVEFLFRDGPLAILEGQLPD